MGDTVSQIINFCLWILGIFVFSSILSCVVEKINDYEFKNKLFNNSIDERTKNRIRKTLSWRIISTIMTFIIGYCLTGNLMTSFHIAMINLVVKSIMFYYHEKHWEKKDET